MALSANLLWNCFPCVPGRCGQHAGRFSVVLGVLFLGVLLETVNNQPQGENRHRKHPHELATRRHVAQEVKIRMLFEES